MATVRATFFFVDSNGAGWTETIYNTAANLTQGLLAANNLVFLRVELLGRDTGLVSVRVSDDEVKRDSQIFSVPFASQSPARAGVSEHANNDIVCRIEGGTTFKVRRSLALRGIPTAQTGPAGVMAIKPGWGGKFDTWVNTLKVDGWAVKFRDKTVPIFDVVGASQDLGTGIVTVTTQLAHGYAPGNQVILSGIVGASEINGLWTILATPTPTTFTIITQQIVGAYVGGGRANKNNYLLAPITKVIPIRVNTHKAGLPFGHLVGRRKARRRR